MQYQVCLSVRYPGANCTTAVAREQGRRKRITLSLARVERFELEGRRLLQYRGMIGRPVLLLVRLLHP